MTNTDLRKIIYLNILFSEVFYMAGRGTFVAQISAANMTIPIEGASVTITEANMQVPQLISFQETA